MKRRYETEEQASQGARLAGPGNKRRWLEEQPGVMVTTSHCLQMVFALQCPFTQGLGICSGDLTFRQVITGI